MSGRDRMSVAVLTKNTMFKTSIMLKEYPFSKDSLQEANVPELYCVSTVANHRMNYRV